MGFINDNQETYYTGDSFGGYRYISLEDLVNNFMFSYVGEGKIVSKANRRDVVFHVKRAMQEFSYDISRVEKIQEVDVPNTLSIPMPQDYVNYVSISYIDKHGIEHPIQKGRMTSAPSEAISQDSEGNYTFDGDGNLSTSTPETITRFNTSNLDTLSFYQNVENESDPYSENKMFYYGQRYGLDSELSNQNGMFVIDEANGTINFSSNLVDRTITIKYISDSLGTDDEMKVHKFAEEAIYKTVAYSILSGMANVPEYIINRFRRERRAAMRTAKIRLYDIRTSDMMNLMRGKSKQIKH